MFILSELSDLVRIPPHTFNLPIQHSITDELNQKYSNKIISNLGLVVTIWDLLDIKDGLLKPGDGGAYVEVRFRCVVWKPFVGEVLSGWVSECTHQGIKVKLEFFDDIFIPKSYLFENTEFKPVEKAWVWKPEPEGDTELYIDINEKIRFRIEEELFFNVKPQSSKEAVGVEEPAKKNAAYALTASMQTEGMGCISWWD